MIVTPTQNTRQLGYGRAANLNNTRGDRAAATVDEHLLRMWADFYVLPQGFPSYEEVEAEAAAAVGGAAEQPRYVALGHGRYFNVEVCPPSILAVYPWVTVVTQGQTVDSNRGLTCFSPL